MECRERLEGYLRENGVPTEAILIVAITQIFRDACPSAACAVYRDMNICFPWSSDSKELEDFRDYCLERPVLRAHL